MVVRAIRSIPSGEEVSENYGPIFATSPEAERKRRLRLQYWFDCNCEACAAHWPILEEIDPTVLRLFEHNCSTLESFQPFVTENIGNAKCPQFCFQI